MLIDLNNKETFKRKRNSENSVLPAATQILVIFFHWTTSIELICIEIYTDAADE